MIRRIALHARARLRRSNRCSIEILRTLSLSFAYDRDQLKSDENFGVGCGLNVPKKPFPQASGHWMINTWMARRRLGRGLGVMNTVRAICILRKREGVFPSIDCPLIPTEAARRGSHYPYPLRVRMLED